MIARVFPRRTKMTPTDDNAFIGEPPLGFPIYDEIHISVCFTWDIPKAEYLLRQWCGYGKIVKIGGPAISGSNGEFTPGKYLREGITITSRGCPNNCPWCFVPKWEGKLKELKIAPGNIVQDNNLLACSKTHIKKVFSMLRTQRAIEFSGGLQSDMIHDWIIEELRSLKIKHIWLAYDCPSDKYPVKDAVEKLKRYFPRDKIRCYVLIGYKDDTFEDSLEQAEERLKWAWDIGTLPFAMRYRTPEPLWQGTYLFTDRRWNLLTRQWTRPAIIKATMKG